MKWAGHMIRLKDERLRNRSDRKKQGGSRKQRRPQLRWEECVKRDLRKEEENWKEKANEREQ